MKENGVTQKIDQIATPAARGTSQTTVFVLFDTSNRMYDSFPYAEDAVADFIRGLDPGDAVAVNSFSRNMARLVTPTHDREAAIAGLRKAVSGDDTALYDSMLLTLRDAEDVEGSKVMVVFSNGPDNSSMLAPEDIRTFAENEGVPIYVVSTEDRNAFANAAFNSLAGGTGGQTYFAPNWRREKTAFRSIDDDLNNSYVISYYPDPRGGSGYRQIGVEISGARMQGYRVRARAGYRPARARRSPKSD
ncbi:MAG: VWA domain-containing protein [Bryobacteraceae bacterium]